MSNDNLYQAFISYPPLKDQQTIANYLDIATAKIDTLIEKQTKLIELLREKRQAVISTAVTRGLDNTVAMKDSGVEWLGEIPEHWKVVSLKYISFITLGKMLTSSDKGNMSFKPYLKAKNIKWMKVNTNNVDNMWFSNDELKSLKLKKNDLLVSEGGEVGRTCIWDNELEECYIQNSVNRVQFTKHNQKFFLYQFFAAAHYGYFDSIVNKISIAHLTKEKLGDTKFVSIPIKEQESIVIYLDEKTSKIDNLVSKSTKAINLLKEKRTALISSAVTGKIDVREAS
jgi:type I restriction enzyme S subunit